ncbi:MAG: carbohydrate binding domain-containing protein [Pontiellaceae bacterium]|nr:carbohydrate binding domain-containing protein [Pontiellaceae bacterium]
MKRIAGSLLIVGLVNTAAAEILLSTPERVSNPTVSTTLTIDTQEAKADASPLLYGLTGEEVNYSFDGGLYAELIRNRSFMESTNSPVHWTLAVTNSYIELDPGTPLNEHHPVSLRWEVGSKEPTRIVNEGYWGIPVYPNTEYKVSFYAKASEGYAGPIGAALTSSDGKTDYAQAMVRSIGTEWKRYELVLKTRKMESVSDGRFSLVTAGDGTVWLNLVSLFPPTWNDRPNGVRKDLMQMLVDLKPKFLRFPGGKGLMGNTIDSRYKWMETLGSINERSGHMGHWGYRSTDGMGLHEFLLWAEELDAEPVLGLYAGYSLNDETVKPGKDLLPYIEEALNEIEYVIGPADSEWGAKRAAAGHPEPFPLRYVEIGYEDWTDKSAGYHSRFMQFYDAITEKYPQLNCISSIGNDQKRKMVIGRDPDAVDEHYSFSTEEIMEDFGGYFDRYSRRGPEVVVGEWTAYQGDQKSKDQSCTANMIAAIGDAVFMTEMERNADIVIMQARTPMLANVNEYQLRPSLIGYNASTVYGSPSYYALKMFSTNYGDEILAATLSNAEGMYKSVTRDSNTGVIYIKFVNTGVAEVALTVELNGTLEVAPNAVIEILEGAPEDANSADEPEKVVPKTQMLKNIKPTFKCEIPPYSIAVIKLKEM